MKKLYYPETAILQGLLAAQVIGTFQVYLSNTELHNMLLRLKAEGYLLVPNLLIMDRLNDLLPAFIGGCFFTCSIGAGLSVFTLSLMWSWDRLLDRNVLFGIVSFILWALALFFANQKGFDPPVTLYFAAIPAIVIAASVDRSRAITGRTSSRRGTCSPWATIATTAPTAATREMCRSTA